MPKLSTAERAKRAPKNRNGGRPRKDGLLSQADLKRIGQLPELIREKKESLQVLLLDQVLHELPKLKKDIEAISNPNDRAKRRMEMIQMIIGKPSNQAPVNASNPTQININVHGPGEKPGPTI